MPDTTPPTILSWHTDDTRGVIYVTFSEATFPGGSVTGLSLSGTSVVIQSDFSISGSQGIGSLLPVITPGQTPALSYVPGNLHDASANYMIAQGPLLGTQNVYTNIYSGSGSPIVGGSIQYRIVSAKAESSGAYSRSTVTTSASDINGLVQFSAIQGGLEYECWYSNGPKVRFKTTYASLLAIPSVIVGAETL